MSHVYSKTDSGLLVAEKGAGHSAVAAALKDYDRELRLVPSVDPKHQTILWKVYAYRGPDQPAVFVLAWQSRTGEPLPLSMRLVDLVAEQARGSRAPRVDEDEANRRLIENTRREKAEIAGEIGRDMAPRISGRRSPCFHRGIHLRRPRAGAMGG